jgi:hypothetical protein
MTIPARYRIEDGRVCIDVHVKHWQQLFDLRDPAPFRERDLDEHVVRYLLDAVQEIPRAHPLKVVVSISGSPEPGASPEVIAEALRSHFEYERVQVDRRLREHVRRGRTALALGLVVLVVCLTLSNLTDAMATGGVWAILSEGLVIAGWVAVWRPLEVLLYEWWPLVDDRRHVDRILQADAVVRFQALVP